MLRWKAAVYNSVKSCWFSASAVAQVGRPRKGVRLPVTPSGSPKCNKSWRTIGSYYHCTLLLWVSAQLLPEQRAPQSFLAVLNACWRFQSTRPNHRRQSDSRVRIKGRCNFFMLQTGVLISLLQIVLIFW